MIAAMFFALSKIVWFVINPGNILLVLLGAGLLAYLLPVGRFKRLGVSLMGAATVLAVVITISPWATWLGLPLENRFPIIDTPPKSVDGIIVAGGVVDPFLSKAKGQVQVGGGVERVLALGYLAKIYPEAKIVYSAGSGNIFDQTLKEADFVAPILADVGVAPGRLLIENQSRNTVENATLTRDMVSPTDDETWILITSAFHMPRTVGTFRKAGWKNLVPYPVDYHVMPGPASLQFNFSSGLSRLNHYLHEWVGLLAYRVMGKTDSFFPAPLADAIR